MGINIPMTNDKPSVIFERANGIIYSREFGARADTRKEIGIYIDNDPRTSDGRPLHEHIQEDKLWGDIRRAACTNPTLQDALDRAIMIYNLSKTDE